MKVGDFIEYLLQFKGLPATPPKQDKNGRWVNTEFSCLGFVKNVFEGLGMDMHEYRYVVDLWKDFGIFVHEEKVKPGDLIFFARKRAGLWVPGHVGIVVNPRKRVFIESPGRAQTHIRIRTWKKIKIRDCDIYSVNPIGFKRPSRKIESPVQDTKLDVPIFVYN